MPEMPNIVFIMSDSMDGRVMGCMGHPAMNQATPNLDRLANKGSLFVNTYTNSPLCVPARASLWSGRYVHHCEAWNNFKGLERDTPTYETHLEKAGCVLKILGKTDYLSGFHTHRARVSAWTRIPNRRLMRPTHTMPPPKVIPGRVERVHRRDWLNVDACIEWLNDEASSMEKPFMLFLGFGAPHPPFLTSEEYLDAIDDDGVEAPPIDRSNHPYLTYFRKVLIQHYDLSEKTVKMIRKVYFAMISEVDRMVGKVLDCLEELGLDESTYVLFASDHGEHAMEHQLVLKHSFYESAVRVPLIAAGPGLRRKATVEDPVSLVDIYPTLMDMAGIPYPPRLDGYSLMPLLKDGKDDNRPDWVFSEYHGEVSATSGFMIRKGPWKYIAYAGLPPQLFNLEDDPWEINNLVDECKSKAEEMESLLRSIVDYDEVNTRVEEYNRAAFMEWRRKHKEAGDYEELMAKIFSGWEASEKEIMPWTDEDEKVIKEWLGET